MISIKQGTQILAALDCPSIINFRDNGAPTHPFVEESIRFAGRIVANSGGLATYGGDPITQKANELMAQVFGARKALWLPTGIAAISIGAGLIDPTQHIMAAKDGHVEKFELDAPGFQAGGASTELLPTDTHGKLSAPALDSCLKAHIRKHRQRNLDAPIHGGILIVEQPSHLGVPYSNQELLELYSICKKQGILFAIDGARLATAYAQNKQFVSELANCCDLLCVGLSKIGGPLGTVLLAQSAKGESLWPALLSHAKRAGMIIDRPWNLAAAGIALFEDGLWLRNAAHAVNMAASLERQLNAVRPKQANSGAVRRGCNLVFASFPWELDSKKFAALEVGLARSQANDFPSVPLYRFATSYSTSEKDIAALVNVASHQWGELCFLLAMGAHPT